MGDTEDWEWKKVTENDMDIIINRILNGPRQPTFFRIRNKTGGVRTRQAQGKVGDDRTDPSKDKTQDNRTQPSESKTGDGDSTCTSKNAKDVRIDMPNVNDIHPHI